MHFAEDLQANVAGADALEAKMLQRIDAHIAAHGLDAPDERPEILRDAYALPERPRVDLKAAGITNVIWACGYACDYSWVKLPVFDASGFPVTQRGVTEFPGLYFLGMHMLHSRKSGVLIGIAEDAAYVADRLEAASSR